MSGHSAQEQLTNFDRRTSAYQPSKGSLFSLNAVLLIRMQKKATVVHANQGFVLANEWRLTYFRA